MKLPAFVLLALLAHPSVAHAGAAEDRNRSTARSLAQEGVGALDRGDAAAASDKLERAYQLMPLPAVGLWSARALAKSGRLVSAAERYLEVSRWSGTAADANVQRQAMADAEKERAALLPRIPELTLVVEGAGPAVEVTLDGDKVPAALIGVAQQVDPRQHVARATSGAAVVERKFDLAEGQRETLRLEFGKSAEAPAPVDAAPPAPPTSPEDKGVDRPWQRPAGIAIGGAGIVGLVVAGVFTSTALSKKSDSEKFCDGGACRSPKGVSLLEDARSAGNVATIAGIAGIALASTGAVLYFTAPSPHGTGSIRVTPLAGATGGGLLARTQF